MSNSFRKNKIEESEEEEPLKILNKSRTRRLESFYLEEDGYYSLTNNI